jgi:phosphoglycolate phosphatase-like HAD superfamily hydrolase
MKDPNLIVLDCDDVMVDYNKHWATMYKRYFNQELNVANHKAYYASEYWGVDWTGRKAEEKEFYDHFTVHGWRDMDALEGAIEATHILKDYGYKIIVVTRMPASGEAARTANLKDLGFKFDAVIGTGHTNDHNPKKPYIEVLKPKYFVDDLIANFTGIETNNQTEFVWLDVGRHHPENEELKKTHDIAHIHNNLLEFVTTKIKK